MKRIYEKPYIMVVEMEYSAIMLDTSGSESDVPESGEPTTEPLPIPGNYERIDFEDGEDDDPA